MLMMSLGGCGLEQSSDGYAGSPLRGVQEQDLEYVIEELGIAATCTGRIGAEIDFQ